MLLVGCSTLVLMQCFDTAMARSFFDQLVLKVLMVQGGSTCNFTIMTGLLSSNTN